MNAAKRSPRTNSNTSTSGIYTRGGFESPANRAEDTSLESLVKLASTRPDEGTDAAAERISIPPLLAFGAKPIASLVPPAPSGELPTRAKVLIAVPWTLLGITFVALAVAWSRGVTAVPGAAGATRSAVAAAASSAVRALEATSSETTVETAPIALDDMPLAPTLAAVGAPGEKPAELGASAPVGTPNADELATAALLAPAANTVSLIESPLVETALVETPAVDSAAIEAAAAAAAGAAGVEAPAAAVPAPNVVHTFDQIEARIQASPGTATTSATSTTPERPSRADVASALRRVQSAVDGCSANIGHATVRLTVANDGSVSAASPTGEYAGTSEGACMAEAVRGARFPAFTASPITISYPFTLH